MKKFIAFLLFISLLLAGCANKQEVPVTIAPTTSEPFWNRLELTEVFMSNINEESSLDEMLDAFTMSCEAPTETLEDIYIYTVSSYEMDGESYLHLMVARQFMVPTSVFCLEIGFGATYKTDDEIKNLHEDVYFEGNWEDFIEYVQSSESYQKLLAREIFSRGYDISCW